MSCDGLENLNQNIHELVDNGDFDLIKVIRRL